ncbi:MAG: hypothetical protein A2Y25_04230 [Candidatus Melainabacteria bacterium GWF2_37_15]|nr:MAG: hypothetical protein A2Y25_04230 [Candidatus Melainabacteria bacterium GWF2_37_15]
MVRLTKEQKTIKINNLLNLFKETNKQIFTTLDLKSLKEDAILSKYIPSKTTFPEFLTFLIENSILKYVCLDFTNRDVKRLFFEEPNVYELAISINPNCYFSHYSAVFINNLTDNIPKIIYINNEQSPKHKQEEPLKQIDITKSFYKEPRTSKNIAKYKDYKICWLNGKNTNNLGVVEKIIDNNLKVKVTNIERTLIDISVSPHYAGGVVEVLNAYKSAKGRFSVEKMANMLKNINFRYPYHQVIGYYLEKAGYKEKEYQLFRDFGIEYKFFVVRNIDDKNRDFNDKWNLYVPKSL